MAKLLEVTWVDNAPYCNSLFGSYFVAGLMQTRSNGGQVCYGAALGLSPPPFFTTVFGFSVSTLGVRQGRRMGLLAVDMTTACVPGWFTGYVHAKCQQER